MPPGVARCACAPRRRSWARLLPRAGAPCCPAPCCQAPHAAIVSTREQILVLRAQCLRERWACPRCGQLVALHHHNFECVDALTRKVREWKTRYR